MTESEACLAFRPWRRCSALIEPDLRVMTIACPEADTNKPRLSYHRLVGALKPSFYNNDMLKCKPLSNLGTVESISNLWVVGKAHISASKHGRQARERHQIKSDGSENNRQHRGLKPNERTCGASAVYERPAMTDNHSITKRPSFAMPRPLPKPTPNCINDRGRRQRRSSIPPVQPHQRAPHDQE